MRKTPCTRKRESKRPPLRRAEKPNERGGTKRPDNNDEGKRRDKQRYVGRRNPFGRRFQPHGLPQGAPRLSGTPVPQAPARNHGAPENRRTPRRSRRPRRAHREKHRPRRGRNRDKRRLGK